MSAPGDDWRPSASPERLRQRAALLQRAREFFAARALTEVDTPLVVNAPVSDVHIHSATVRLSADPAAAAPTRRAATRWQPRQPDLGARR